MTVQPIAWSHSRVKAYLDCPKRFYLENIAKAVKYEQGEPQIEGERVHKALELRLVNGVELPPQYAKYERLVQVLKAMPGTTYGERDLCLNADLRPTGYFEKDAFVRVTIDVTNLNGKVGHLFDYKNGKVTLDEDQLKLYAAVGFHVFTEVDTFHTKYIWLQHSLVEGKTYHRHQLPELWRELLAVPTAMQKAAERNDWPAKPSRRCGYCTVNKYGKCGDAAERYRGS